jgi:branched-chain amino acid aminotransferase
MKSMIYFNGSYIREEELRLPLGDLGLTRGYGVFDFLRTYQGRPFHLEDHLMRLRYSAAQIGIEIPHSLEELRTIVAEVLKRNGGKESSVKILVTGGVSLDSFASHSQPHVIVSSLPLPSFAPDCYTKGIETATTASSRPFPSVKTLYYLPAIVAMKKGGPIHEILYLNPSQGYLEGATSNFFVFQGDTLITPPADGILLGITREIVLNLAKDHFAIEIRKISPTETFSEAFITSSTREIMPVSHIDGRGIGQGERGPNTAKLMHLFANYTHNEEWKPLDMHPYVIYNQ